MEMPSSLYLEANIHGTLEDFNGGEPVFYRGYPDIAGATKLLIDRLFERTNIFQKIIFENVGVQSYNTTVKDIERHFTENASDSVIERSLLEDSNFEVELTLRVGYDVKTGLYRFEVEDNGLGIDSKSEPRLFSRLRHSHKRGKLYLSGDQGVGLSLAKGEVISKNGKVFHRNKGPMQGAVFGYTAPFLNL